MIIIKKCYLLFVIVLLSLASTSCYSERFTQEEIDKEMHKWWLFAKHPNFPEVKRLVNAGKLFINMTNKEGVECSALSTFLSEADKRDFSNFSRDLNLTKEKMNQRNKELLKIIRYLLAQNASLCEKHPYHTNLSRHVVDHPDILKELLNRGDDPNIVYMDLRLNYHDYEKTAILFALSVQPAKKRYKVIKMLLEHGASATNLGANHIDYPYYIPIVSEGMYRQNTSLEWRVRIIKLLIHHGAKIRILTYAKDGKKQCNFQADIFRQEAIDRKEPEMLALWKKYNTDNPYKYCKPDDFKQSWK